MADEKTTRATFAAAHTEAGDATPEELETLAELDQKLARKMFSLDPDAEAAERPFDVEVVRPRAMSLRKLYQLTNKTVPPEIESALGGAKRPILVAHGMTAFHRAGKSPSSIWGMGYQVKLDTNDADTIAVEPGTAFLKVAHLDQKVELSLGVGGEMGIPRGGSNGFAPIAGLGLREAQIGGSTDQSFALSIQFDFKFLKVQAAGVGAGGARWNIYRQEERLDSFQPLFQTMMVPAAKRTLDLTIQTWARGPGRLWGLGKPRQWTSDAIRYTVDIDGND